MYAVDSQSLPELTSLEEALVCGFCEVMAGLAAASNALKLWASAACYHAGISMFNLVAAKEEEGLIKGVFVNSAPGMFLIVVCSV